MGRFFYFFQKQIWFTTILLLIPTIFSVYEIKNIQFDPSFDRLLIEDDPAKRFYEKSIKTFGDDETAVIHIEDDNLFDLKNVQLIQQVVWKLEEVGDIERIDSIFTTSHFTNEDDMLSTVPVFDDIPETQEEVDTKIESALRNPLFKDLILSSDKKALAISMTVSDQENSLKDIADTIDEVAKPLQNKFKVQFQTGTPDFERYIFKEIVWAQEFLLPIVVSVIALLIFLGTGSIHAGVVPIFAAGLALLWTGAFMSLMNIPIQMLVSCVPGIIFILGSTEITHLMTVYNEKIAEGIEKSDAIKIMGEKVGGAVFLTALTTVVGFLSVTLNDIVMLKEFGIVCSFALVAIFFITLVYVPLHLKLFTSGKPKGDQKEHRPFFFHGKIHRFFQMVLFGKTSYFFLALFLLGSAALSTRVRTDNDSIGMLKKSSPARVKMDLMSEKFPGINNIFLVLEAQEGTFRDPENLKRLFALEQDLHQSKIFDNAQGFGTQMALINREMMGGDQKDFNVPDQKNLIAQYLLSLTRDDLESFVSSDYKKANIILRHNLPSSSEIEDALAKLDVMAKTNLSDSSIKYEPTSRSLLNLRASLTIIKSQALSILIMLLCIIVVISFLFLDFRLGLVAIPTNFFPIFGLFGIMGLLDIPLNIGTCIVAAITVGIAVDDTIHFFVRFGDASKIVDEPLEAAKMAMDEEIRPIVTTSLALSVGFSLIAFSDFVPLIHFGLLSAFVIILAMISDLLVCPMSIVLFKVKDMVNFSDLLFSHLPQNLIEKQPLFTGLKKSEIKNIIRKGRVVYWEEGASKDMEHLPSKMFVVLDGKIALKREGRRQSDNTQSIKLKQFEVGSIIKKGSQEKDCFYQSESLTKILVIDDQFLGRLSQKSPRIYSVFCDNIDKITVN